LTATISPTRRGVLLVNLGSPDSTRVADVRRYLREFLMDERVLDVPYLTRWLIVHLAILPFRPRKSAEAYRKIWWPEGSPLVVISQRVRDALQAQLSEPVALAMRYQNPSVAAALGELVRQGINSVTLLPLYPQYALSSYETVVAHVRQIVERRFPQLRLSIVPPFFDQPDYLEALVASARGPLEQEYDHLLFSFHGLPERHLRRSDPTGRHCLQAPDCCRGEHPAHRVCYRAQAFKMVEAFVRKVGIPPGKYSIAFQSRLGRTPWLQPYTDQELARLPARGVRRLRVICPAFVADCLETLEEIALRGKETFLAAGGTEFSYIPCLNEHPLWIQTLARLASPEISHARPEYVESPTE
jgi:protoporphyrin/coproporphyrin ferrochelatase